MTLHNRVGWTDHSAFNQEKETVTKNFSSFGNLKQYAEFIL